MKHLAQLSFLIFVTTNLLAQAPQGLNYQAVMRDAQGQILANKPLDLTFAIHQDSAGGTVVYTESQSLSTNSFGLFTAVIGTGTTTDQLSAISWATGDHFLRVQVDFGSGLIDLGTTQLLSVPYALYANEVANVDDADADPSNELQDLSLNGTTLEITNGSSVDLSSLVEDADADPTNELQLLGLSGTSLSLSGANTVSLSGLVNDADADPSNELQLLGLSGTTLSLSGGNSVSLSSLVNDADANPSNELQTLSLSGSDLTLSNGNTINLSSLPGTLADQAFSTGTGSTPSSTTSFLVSPATITVTSSSQVVVVTSHGLLGNSSLFNAADGLDLFIGYRLSSTSNISLVSPGMLNVRVGTNERHVFGQSAVLTNLLPGTYEFGLAGDDDGNGNWNSNGAGYTTVLLYN